MKAVIASIAAIVVAILVVVLFDFRVTESGSLPEVQVSGGNMPEAEVRGTRFSVKTDRKEVKIPTDVDVSVKTEEKGIKVPTDVDFELPEDQEGKPVLN